MQLIKLNDISETIINLEYVEYIDIDRGINGSNYFVLSFGFISGYYKSVKYAKTNEISLSKDIEYISSFLANS